MCIAGAPRHRTATHHTTVVVPPDTAFLSPVSITVFITCLTQRTPHPAPTSTTALSLTAAFIPVLQQQLRDNCKCLMGWTQDHQGELPRELFKRVFLAGTWNLEPAIAMCRLIVSHPSLAIDVSCHIPAQSLQPLPGLFGQGGTQARNACPLGGGFAGFAAHGTLRLR
eukprot:CAMPEP_0174310584 /NCGR_PEP_ID=MMETSP0810-20121108/3139_1 /TAXON_ID=73025 ORGANISM="Eutreptiella gymnastica-like, Strain CCMP1594" /NCGR_SAMPLE_ID=MMETSP0810 /ASSEMBLY_ACC=CAM_ASM_000659 /LENGTH=167 /DNA_ID=CAMNT_0015418529 /DNA_START=823 /DNA_END=1327 /DNA_ORIENTATION=+